MAPLSPLSRGTFEAVEKELGRIDSSDNKACQSQIVVDQKLEELFTWWSEIGASNDTLCALTLPLSVRAEADSQFVCTGAKIFGAIVLAEPERHITDSLKSLIV